MTLGRRLRREDGGVLLFVVFGLPALVLVFALAVDVGNWLLHKRALQNQVDAAALAGGDLFGNCFVGNGSGGFAMMTAEAQKYDGKTGPYNPQIGGSRKGVLAVLYNSKTYAQGGPAADDTPDTGLKACDPILTPRYTFDVKGTDATIPMIFGGLGFSTLAQINAHARVELRKEQISSGSLPLAVPNVNPKTVTATFVDASGAPLAGCAGGCVFQLAKGLPAGTLSMWSASATIPATPNGTTVGVRIGLATSGQGCAGTSGGTGFICFDNGSTNVGLVKLAAYANSASSASPGLRGVWPTTLCAGSPFFSDVSIVAPATTCGAGVQAQVDFGTASDPTLRKCAPPKIITNCGGVKASLTAAVNGGTPAVMTYSGGVWSTSGSAFGVQAGLGPQSISLHWEQADGTLNGKDCSKTPTPSQCKGDFTNVQQLYSGSEARSDPVKALSVGESAASNPGAPYALNPTASSHTLTVTVGLAGSLRLTPQTTLLRLVSGSRSSAIACDGSGVANFTNSIQTGCTTPYQLNATGICPDAGVAPSPADCVNLETGNFGNPTSNALDTRFTGCPANYWPSYNAASDPRILQLMVTDFSYLGGSGNVPVPVVDFGEFYITGWGGAACANNEPWPASFAPLTEKRGDIWGHFIKDAPSAPGTGSTTFCDPNSITPCVPVLTK